MQRLVPELSEPPNTYVLLMQTINRVLFVRAHEKGQNAVALKKFILPVSLLDSMLGVSKSRYHVDGGDHLKPPVSP